MQKLTVKGRYLAYENGDPFFYLGDTAWEMLHKLSREEIEYFLSERAKQGFTAIQTVVLSEFEGVTTPNFYGRLPLLFEDGLPNPETPDVNGEYSYWDHIDFAVCSAEKYGLYLTLLPTWGDKFNIFDGKGPEIFTKENAYTYGRWIAERYSSSVNIIWMLGGDRPIEPKHRPIIDAMARGIRDADTEHLITFHPRGASNSADVLEDASYIDFHTAQTGHAVDQCYISDSVMRRMRDISQKPFMDSESRYEEHPACFDASIGYLWGADDVRQNSYWNVFTGACGQTYGNHNIWSMNRKPNSYYKGTWNTSLSSEGANQLKFLKELRLKRDYFSFEEAPELICENFEGMGHMVAAKGKGYAYIYSPLGMPFTIDPSKFEGGKCIKAIWFDPRTGNESFFAVLNSTLKTLMVPPTSGKGCDWVLCLERVE